MGLIEFIGEMMSPKPVGSVDLERKRPAPRSSPVVMAHASVSIVALTLLLKFFALPFGPLGIASCILYIIVGTLLRPKPNLDNVGLFGGLIDHPLRLSDDVNRMLIFLTVLLWPGRLIGTGFLGLVYWIGARGRR